MATTAQAEEKPILIPDGGGAGKPKQRSYPVGGYSDSENMWNFIY